ncbi:MAG TPA: C40 family peptidase [Thermoanaerobaculia bacterium]
MKKFAVMVVLAALLVPVAFAEEAPQQQRPGMVERALSWLGVKYRFGGQDENKGFDCAGLVRRVFSTMAVELPRTAAAQFRQGCIVQRDELQPGDLVFFRNTYKRGISHVGIYIGDGQFVHAASRRRAVTVDRLDSPYFEKRFAGGRRVASLATVVPLPVPDSAMGMP